MSVYVFSYFPFYFEGRMWDLIVSVPDHCLAFYFELLICVVEFIVSRTSITLCIIFIAIFSSKLTSKLTLVTEVLEFLTKNVCCLKGSKTSNAQEDCRIDHRSRAGLRAVWSIRQSLRVLWWHVSVVIYFVASHSCLSVIQRQNPLEFMKYGRKFNFNLIWAMNWEIHSLETCDQVRLNQSFT